VPELKLKGAMKTYFLLAIALLITTPALADVNAD
jgi:hypothetical protein